MFKIFFAFFLLLKKRGEKEKICERCIKNLSDKRLKVFSQEMHSR